MNYLNRVIIIFVENITKNVDPSLHEDFIVMIPNFLEQFDQLHDIVSVTLQNNPNKQNHWNQLMKSKLTFRVLLNNITRFLIFNIRAGSVQ